MASGIRSAWDWNGNPDACHSMADRVLHLGFGCYRGGQPYGLTTNTQRHHQPT